MKHHRAFGALVALLAVGTVACGDGDTSDSGTSGGKVIKVTMTENAYSPTEFKVKAGEEVTFEFRNNGKLVHEAVIGNGDKQADHEAEMMEKAERGDKPGMEHGASESDALSIEPGKTGELTHRFDKPGEILIGCHEPGHYKAGMKATITVT